MGTTFSRDPNVKRYETPKVTEIGALSILTLGGTGITSDANVPGADPTGSHTD